ncbi:MAG: hypothetical protein NTW37_22665, partial [Proteobacteria bacterium]|nr:hypothetical protein [Pseudomonadota bacterium]
FNTIGWAGQNIFYNLADALLGTRIGSEAPAEVRAYITGSSVNAAGALSVTAVSDAAVDARMGSSSTAIKAALTSTTAVSVGAVIGMNKVSTLVQAYVDAATTVSANGNIRVEAEDTSAIDARVKASSLSVSVSGSSSLSVSVGLSVARNEIKNDMTAFIRNAASLTATNGSVSVTATENARIDATSTATSITLGVGGSGGKAFGGGGATAVNYIRGKSNAFIEGGSVTATGTGAGMGDVTVASDNTSSIDATVAAISVAGAAGAGSSPAASIGFALARNFIGWDSSGGASVATTYTSSQKPATLTAGQTVKIVDGARAGDIYEYVGSTLTDGDPNTAGNQAIDLATQNYQDRSAWKQVNVNASALEAQAYIKNASVAAAGALEVAADSTASIDAIVVAGSAALAGGGTTGLALSGAGVYAENRIKTFVKAFVDGDGTAGINANGVSITADDASGINAVAGAASVAAAIGGSTGASVSIGLSVAFNEVSNEVEAYILNADTGLSATGGDVTIEATSRGQHLFDLTLGGSLTTANLDDAAQADQNDPDTAASNEASVDLAADMTFLGQLRSALNSAFAGIGRTALAIADSVATEPMYTTASGTQNLREGTTVKLASGYANGGVAGRVYRYIGANADNATLGTQNYANTSNWVLVDTLKLSTLVAGQSWALLAPDGMSYVLEKSGSVLRVSTTTVNAVSAAASLAAGFGGSTGVAISGAGAVAQNVILTRTNAYGQNSLISSSDDVSLSASSTSSISSTVAAASLAIGGGGSTGVGVSIGVSVAQNFIGWTPGASTSTPAQVQAYLKDSSVRADGDLTHSALARQTIQSVVLAGSAAVAAGGSSGVGVSGAGAYAENRIGVDVKSYIDGDRATGTTGIVADAVTLSASDTSSITSLAGAASLAAALGGTGGISVSVGAAIARNTITSAVEAYIKDADGLASSTTDAGVTASAGAISVSATETATINAIAAAASLAAGIGGTTGIAVSGAGADAANVILTRTNAYAQGSTLSSTGNVALGATNTATIDAKVVSAAFSAAIGGTAGVGASIGVALARNFIGKQLNGTSAPAEVQAYLADTSVSAGGSLALTATSNQTISTKVLAGSVALAGGGTFGGALAGAGASATNDIAVKVKAYIDGDGASGISATGITLTARDTSSISATVGAASIAASVGGTAGISAAVGVALARNTIANQVEAVIRNADTGVTATAGAIVLDADQVATITASSGAAALGAAVGGVAGIAI